MGFFKKAKEAAAQAQQAFAPQAGPQGPGAVHVHGAGPIDPFPAPQFQDQKRPETVAMVVSARLMVFDQISHGFCAKIAAIQGPRVQ